MTLRIALCSTLLTAALALPQAVLAQQTNAEAEAASTAPGEPYLVATHRDWEVLCTRIGENQEEICEMYQLLMDEDDTPIAEISIAAFPEGGEVVAGATITTPLETFLPAGLGWRVGDSTENMRVEGFRMCAVIGCIARLGFEQNEVDAMMRGSHAVVTIAPFVAVDQPVDIRVSLLGFTAALNDLRARLPADEPAE